MYKHLLVPLDGTPLSWTTVEKAIEYAREVRASLTFVHARADLGASSDGALLRTMSPESFAEAAGGNARAVVAKAEAAARGAGVDSQSIVLVSDRPHEAILEAAQQAACDLIFMASHGRRGLQGALLGSVTRKVLERATLPVLVAAVESNLPTASDEQRALAIVRDEHRSLAAVLHALLERVDNASILGEERLLRAMVFYIEQFPQRLHHPKEDAYLFRLLRSRTNECDEVIAGLEQQHRTGGEHFARMRSALESGDRDAFAQHVRDFAQLQWAHMAAEERLVLPAASHHLLPEDWREIAAAFSTNGDPRFGTGESFDTLASRLINMAAVSS